MKPYPQSIIFADDDPVMHGFVKRALDDNPELKLGFCHDGLELVEMVLANPPDIILLDLTMPGMDGLEALHEIRKHESAAATLIIVITGHTELKMHSDFKALGIIGIIHKPFSIGMLPERIRYFWHLHHTGEDIVISSRM